MTILATTAAPSHRDRSRSARARGFLVNLGLTLTMLVALAFLLPSLMGLQRYVIMGGSMEGTYDLGSVVLSEVVPVSELEVGDVITYVPPAESGITTLVTHRIVSIDGEDLRTQGDANPASWAARCARSGPSSPPSPPLPRRAPSPAPPPSSDPHTPPPAGPRVSTRARDMTRT